MDSKHKDIINKLIRDNLNDEQYNAATYLWDKDSIIIAWAWSWKTWTLSYKVLNLLSHDVKEDEICIITFTNKAANEISWRINKLLRDELWYENNWLIMWTFHSIFLQLLKDIYSEKEIFWLNTLYTNTVQVATNVDKTMKVVKEEFFWWSKFYEEDWKISNELFEIFWRIKNLWITNEIKIIDYLINKEWLINKIAYEPVYKAFEKYFLLMQEQNLLNFDDILYLILKYIRENKKVKEFITNKFKYICVDEAQDTNEVQFDILKEMKANITYIWDDFQSIYKFRWSQLEEFLNISKWKNVKVFKLVTNYRSLDYIVESWNQIIKENTWQSQKKLISDRWNWTEKYLENEDLKIKIYQYDNTLIEVKQTLLDIKKFKEENNLKWSDFAVLYRLNESAKFLEQSAKELWIPYYIKSNLKSKDELNIDVFISVLKFLSNNKDVNSLVNILTYFDRTWNYENLYQELINWKTFDSLYKQYNLENAKMFFDSYRDRINNFDKNFINDLLDWLWFYPITHENTIDLLFKYYKTWYKYSKEKTCDDFINWYSLWNYLEESNIDAVNFMTVHSAKWLEFKYVSIIVMQNNIFPLLKKIHDWKDLEEERRLFYVAITRARDILTMSYSLQTISRKWNQKFVKMNWKSWFLDELSNKYVHFEDRSYTKNILNDNNENEIDEEELNKSLWINLNSESLF